MSKVVRDGDGVYKRRSKIQKIEDIKMKEKRKREKEQVGISQLQYTSSIQLQAPTIGSWSRLAESTEIGAAE